MPSALAAEKRKVNTQIKEFLRQGKIYVTKKHDRLDGVLRGRNDELIALYLGTIWLIDTTSWHLVVCVSYL